MDSLTKGSGIAVSMLVAATASVLLLLPGHPRAGSLRDPGPSGGAMMASAVVTSSPDTPRPGGRYPAASPPVPHRPATGSHPVCRAADPHRARAHRGRAHHGRARAGLRHQGRGSEQLSAGSCRAPRTHRDQESPGRLPRYDGIRPDLPR